MDLTKSVCIDPFAHLRAKAPDLPTLYYCPGALRATARRFIDGFPGLVTYAIKCNDRAEVLSALVEEGVLAYDVASPPEIRAVKAAAPHAALHYNNPVRSRAEIAEAVRMGVVSYSVDSISELEKLIEMVPPEGIEIAVRFKLAVDGAAYNFGAKFGAQPDEAERLLARVVEAGYRPSMTFHPGTQCVDPEAWRVYILEAARIAKAAGVTLERLNVGGGFPSERGRDERVPALEEIFAVIAEATEAAFEEAPLLVCEPGRAMVADAYALALRVKALRSDGAVFLNDGIYGTLAESLLLGTVKRMHVLGPEGPRTGAPVHRTVFGPTCDSMDMIPGGLDLPSDMEEGDHLLINGMGAYTIVTCAPFNGYGIADVVTVNALEPILSPAA
jgi:ornithine decarboxylase